MTTDHDNPESGSTEHTFAGRTALVTGGTRGIGAATSARLAGLGANVIATYRSDRDTAESFAAQTSRGAAGSVAVLPYDLTAAPDEAGSGDRLLDTLDADGTAIDILVLNAAGPYPKVAVSDLSVEDLTAKVAADVGATHLLVQRLMPSMSERGFGRVVMVGSMHAFGPTAPGMVASGTAKAAVAAYLTYVVDELTGEGVTANLVDPGFVDTSATTHLPDAVRTMIGGLTPSGRHGQPDDIAGMIALLVRPEAGFVNGARIPVTGGLNGPVSIPRVLAATSSHG